MILSPENYYSCEANEEYISVSQYKDFCGTLGKIPCEAAAMAKIKGEWECKKTVPMLIGSYIDSHFEDTLDQFKIDHPEVFTKTGALKSEYRKAEEVIARIERDKYFMKFMSGQKQVIMIGEIGDAKWKIKIDSYLPGICITDLKIMKSLRDTFWARDVGYMDFVQYWGYDLQGAVYQEIVRQNTGMTLPFYIAAASKEAEPDIEIIQVDDHHLKEKLYEVESNTHKILAIKLGEYEPLRCEHCDYCKHTKVLNRPIHYSELMTEV